MTSNEAKAKASELEWVIEQASSRSVFFVGAAALGIIRDRVEQWKQLARELRQAERCRPRAGRGGK